MLIQTKYKPVLLLKEWIGENSSNHLLKFLSGNKTFYFNGEPIYFIRSRPELWLDWYYGIFTRSLSSEEEDKIIEKRHGWGKKVYDIRWPNHCIDNSSIWNIK